MLLDSAVPSRRQNSRSSKSADRLTPAHPERGACRIRLRRSDARLHTDTAKATSPPKAGRSLPRSTLTTRQGSRQTMKTDEIEAMKQAIAAYAGPVTRYPPGKALAKPLRRKKAVDEATRWLRRHRHDVSVPKPFVDDNVDGERGRRRKARAERKRMRRAANAAARKRIREQ